MSLGEAPVPTQGKKISLGLLRSSAVSRLNARRHPLLDSRRFVTQDANLALGKGHFNAGGIQVFNNRAIKLAGRSDEVRNLDPGADLPDDVRVIQAVHAEERRGFFQHARIRTQRLTQD